MTVTALVANSPLMRITEEIKNHLLANEFLASLIVDSKKDPSQAIKNVPLNWRSLSKDYELAIYHTCREQVVERNGLMQVRAPIYIDSFIKVNPKFDNIFDKNDQFAYTILSILYDRDFDDFNYTVDALEFQNKNIWQPDPSTDSEKIPDEKLLNYICQMSFYAYYTLNPKKG